MHFFFIATLSNDTFSLKIFFNTPNQPINADNYSTYNHVSIHRIPIRRDSASLP